MRSFYFFLLLIFAFASSGSAAPAAPAAAADQPKNLIADPVNDPTWKQLFTQLAPDKARRSKFEEQRIFPFRTKPVVLF